MGGYDTYTPHVVRYLHSSPGRDTKPSIAARLYALGPGQLGMSDPPTQAQLHIVRQCLDDLERMARDTSGAWEKPYAVILSA